MTAAYDIIVVGSGFAGSLIAMIAKRLGRSVLLLEKGKHPRVVIGESSTPLSNLLLGELADRYDLPDIKPLTKWGTWQDTYAQVPCGLKRGFSFFHHDLDGAKGAHDVSRQLLVAASPHDRIADTHWYRAAFDELLMLQATQFGVDYVDQIDLHAATRDGDHWELEGKQHGNALTFHAKFLIDATGPRGFLHRALSLGELELPDYPPTSALYSHFSGVSEFEPLAPAALADAPYPADAAALHHVFDGGWIWILRFNNGITSAGVAASDKVASRFGFATKESAWRRLLDSLPMVKKQFVNAKSDLPFIFAPRLSFRSSSVAGPGWALLPSAAGFVDPLLSTGFPLTLLGVARLAEILERDWGSSGFQASLQHYARQTDGELLAAARLIGALYKNMNDFSMFRSLSLIYFAAASYSETARRLERPQLANSFLLYEDPLFGPRSRLLLERAREDLNPSEKLNLEEQIYDLIEKFDVAGLGCRRPDHCYPIDAADLFASAHKLGAGANDIETMLDRAGFYSTGS